MQCSSQSVISTGSTGWVCVQSLPRITHTLLQPVPPHCPFPPWGTPGAVPTAQAAVASPTSSATCTSYSRQCGGILPPGGLQATRSSSAADMETTSCFGAEGFARRGEKREKVRRCSQTAPGRKASVHHRQPLSLFPVDGVSELSWLSATMLEEQDVTESGGWIIYFNLTHRLDGILALGCSTGNLKHGGVSTVLRHVPLAAASLRMLPGQPRPLQ